MRSSSRLIAAAMAVGILAIPCAVRATVLFGDNFSNDTDVFAYPDSSAPHLPGPTSSGQGTWDLVNGASSPIQAGVITNTLPGGGTGGAAGNTHYMAMTRSGGHSEANADFASPVSTSAGGTLSVQWDIYDVGPANYVFELEDTPTDTGNVGPYVEASYFGLSSGDMELGARTGPSATYNDLGGFPTNAWVHMDMELNLAASNYQFLVNGVSQGTFAYIDSGISTFKALNFEGASNAGEVLYVDNVNVNYTPVPEPASLSLLVVGSLIAVKRRRSRA